MVHINRRILYFPAVTLTALTFTLTVVLAISTYRNLHREQEQMEASLVREGIALLRLFETVVHTCSGNLPEEASRVQQLATVVAPNDDVAYIYLFDPRGKILAHTSPQWVGQQIDGGIPQGEEILAFRRDDATEHLFEIRSSFHPVSSQNTPRERGENSIHHYLAIGLKMTALEQIHQSDHKHTMMMAAMLVLLGSASLFFILIVQNFYLVQRTLNRTKSYIHYVVESLANGLISLDADGMVTTINPAAAELIGISEAKSKRLSFDVLFPEQVDEIKNVLCNDSPILNLEMGY
ncbi:MAG: PAS domain-containing protein, partial [Bacteroidota bacterium]